MERTTPHTYCRYEPHSNTAEGIYAERRGEGEPLLLLHGLAGSGRWWARNSAALARHFEVYALDLPGFGRSCSARPFALADIAKQLIAWMDHRRIARAHVVGHSMGGFVAASLAADAPQRVNRLVLVDAAIAATPQRSSLDMCETLRTLPFLPGQLLDIFKHELYDGDLRTVLAATRAMFNSDLPTRLARIVAPSLIVWGENDPMVPREVGVQLARTLRARRMALIRHAGHLPMWEQPIAFNRVLLDFLLPTPQGETQSA
ncbi:alpha/beta fold hydrolase [Candidatus Gracilibacteria bacterium]|nr:alpha/beta fold hydrolase [Candidatus Gracilibacteria bacterium]